MTPRHGPVPVVECSKCEAAYVLRIAHAGELLSRSPGYVYMPDCRCNRPARFRAVTVHEDGTREGVRLAALPLESETV